MDFRYAICVVALLLAACPEESATQNDSVTQVDPIAEDDLLVYADRGARQCEPDGMSLDASAQILINAGTDVLRSTCGIRTGIDYPAVCGGGTSDILVHEIPSVNPPAAEPLGFEDISALVDDAAGTGYELFDCADRQTVN